jgi:hypothetical protein
MGRTSRSLARRRVFVGVLALGALALAACSAPPLKDEPPDPEPECVTIYLPPAPGDPQTFAAPAPGETVCLPICAPGQDPFPPNGDPQQRLAADAAARADQELPECVIICREREPGPDPAPSIAPGPEPGEPRCNVQPCMLIPPGQPGACDEARR